MFLSNGAGLKNDGITKSRVFHGLTLTKNTVLKQEELIKKGWKMLRTFVSLFALISIVLTIGYMLFSLLFELANILIF